MTVLKATIGHERQGDRDRVRQRHLADTAGRGGDDSNCQNDRERHRENDRQRGLLIREQAEAWKLVEVEHSECPSSSVAEGERPRWEERIDWAVVSEALEIVLGSHCGNG